MPTRRRPSIQWWSLDENGGPDQPPSVRTVAAPDVVNRVRPLTEGELGIDHRTGAARVCAAPDSFEGASRRAAHFDLRNKTVAIAFSDDNSVCIKRSGVSKCQLLRGSIHR